MEVRLFVAVLIVFCALQFILARKARQSILKYAPILLPVLGLLFCAGAYLGLFGTGSPSVIAENQTFALFLSIPFGGALGGALWGCFCPGFPIGKPRCEEGIFMKKWTINAVVIGVFFISFYAVMFDGFAFPSLSNSLNSLLRVIVAFCIQVFVVVNCKKTWVRLLPTIASALIAVYFFMRLGRRPNTSYILFFMDFGTPLVGCLFGWSSAKLKIR